MNLHPVLVAIPECEVGRSPGQVRRQREAARRALAICTGQCGAPRDGWIKDQREVPLPNAGWYWSVSHKRQWACAVIADQPVGIDIERIEPRPRRLHTMLADSKEWDIVGDASWHSFFRLWTAKEAVLKSAGTGVAGFSDCRLVESPDDRRMTLVYKGRQRRIEHAYHDGHVAAVTSDAGTVHWHVKAGDALKHLSVISFRLEPVPGNRIRSSAQAKACGSEITGTSS